MVISSVSDPTIEAYIIYIYSYIYVCVCVGSEL